MSSRSDRPWHPKLTVYRLSLGIVTILLSTTKAFCPSRGSVTVEWIAGIVVFPLVFFLSYFDRDENAQPRWFFNIDVLDIFRVAPTLDEERGFLPLVSSSPVDAALLLHRSQCPTITGYRLLVTIIVVSIGSTKGYLTYRGETAAPQAIEWLYGGVVSLVLYWLGLYEDSPRQSMPSFFIVDRKREAMFIAKLLLGPSASLIICWGIKEASIPLLFKMFDKASRLHDAGRCFYEMVIVVYGFPLWGLSVYCALAVAWLCFIVPFAAYF